MREIKFRAMKHGQWHIFDFSDAQRWARELLQVMAKEDYELSFDTPFLQFTGLHDKNSKEIWEGDVCMVGHGRDKTVVEYFKGSFVFQSRHLGYMFMHDQASISEVLGNIYENPELLKGDSC